MLLSLRVAIGMIRNRPVKGKGLDAHTDRCANEHESGNVQG